MDSLYLWPDNPVASIGVIWGLSVLFLWAAREPMLRVFRRFGRGVENGLKSTSGWCEKTAQGLEERSAQALRGASELELQAKMSREFQRIDGSFSEKLTQYAALHRKLDDLMERLEGDYNQCLNSPPEVPGWAGAVEAVGAIQGSTDPNVKKVLDGIRESVVDAEKKALKGYRDDTAKRHKILGKMRPDWKEVRNITSKMQGSVGKALQTSSKLEAFIDEYQKMWKGREQDAHAASYSAFKPFIISLLVMGIALGGAFINFQLIALPMSELVPAGARIGGLPVSMVSALILVLMETAVGIFLMDMLGITDLFPKLATLPSSRRKLILGLSLVGLFFLAGIEASLAVLREQIVAADASLKMALAGQEGAAVTVAETAHSNIPMIGQACLGFILPWILAMVAIPLEMLLESARHVMASTGVFFLHVVGTTVRFVTGAISAVNSASNRT